jgi:hypothetical protein
VGGGCNFSCEDPESCMTSCLPMNCT